MERIRGPFQSMKGSLYETQERNQQHRFIVGGTMSRDDAERRGRHRPRLQAYVAIAMGIGLSVTSVGAAHAVEPEPDVFDPVKLLSAVAPAWLANTADIQGTTVDTQSGRGSAAGVTITKDLPVLDAEVAGSVSAPEVLSVTVPGASVVGEADGISVLDKGDGAATYVQPLGTGIGLMTALPDASGIESFTYKLDVPEGTQLQTLPTGSFVLRTPDAGAVGGLRAPLAVDVDGNPVPSTFQWSSDGTLTQVVDATDLESGPLVSLMSWTYGVLIPIDNMTTAQKSEAVYYSMRNSCFNCMFPVQGAPANWPAMEQLLPLYVGIPLVNFACIFNGSFAQWYGGSFYWGFDFRAAPGHVDGVGSTIAFQIIPGTSSPQRSLWVDAWVENDLLNNDVYKAGAIATWVQFANNMSAAS